MMKRRVRCTPACGAGKRTHREPNCRYGQHQLFLATRFWLRREKRKLQKRWIPAPTKANATSYHFFFCIRKKEVASTPAIGVAGLKQAQHSEHVIEHCNRDQDQGRPADRNKLPTGYGHGSCMRALLCIDAAGM
jgi:hypothetical protein